MERRDIEALLAARQELGPTYDAALVESFADRVERALDEKVGSSVDDRRHREMLERRQMIFQFVLGAASMVAAIPISIVLGVTEQLPRAAGRLGRDRRGQRRARLDDPPRQPLTGATASFT